MRFVLDGISTTSCSRSQSRDQRLFGRGDRGKRECCVICYHVMFSADIYSPAEYMLSETRAEAKSNSSLDKDYETSQVFARLLGGIGAGLCYYSMYLDNHFTNLARHGNL
ncbi:hypothetical protein J3459_011197 [Metarhizium acridum]|nr:hypothetical protein J3459_011197 [Metarhizium acridum]